MHDCFYYLFIYLLFALDFIHINKHNVLFDGILASGHTQITLKTTLPRIRADFSALPLLAT